jgi:CzcA family heavy metal efflux pump
MLNSLIKFALNRRPLVLFLYLIISIFGIYTLSKLPVDVLPDLNRPRVTVFAEAEGMSAEDVEKIVTLPLERTLRTIASVDAVRSSSAGWLSVVNVEFDWWSSVNINRQRVYEKIASVTLPDGVHLTVAPESALMGEVLWMGLTSTDPKISQSDLRLYAETELRQSLSTVSGISNLLIMWGSAPQYTISIDPAKLAQKHLTIEDLQKSLSDITNPGWAGIAIDKKSEYPIKLNPIQNTEEKIGSIALPNGNILKDIASIEVGKNSQRRWDALIDGKEWVIIRVSKVPNANTVDLTNTLLAKITEIQKTLPKWIELNDDIFRQTWFIEKWLTNVEEALRDAAIIVAIIVVLFLLNARTAFITMISLPITLLLSAIVFYIFWVGINIMVLGGLTIAIGELVDDAIVDMENIFRRLRLNALLPSEERIHHLKVIFEASKEVRWSVVYATILQLIVFIPFLLLPWIDGKILAPIGMAYITSMIMSLLVAVTFVPVICSYLLPTWIEKRHGKISEDTWFTEKLKHWAKWPILWSLKNPQKALLFALLSIPLTLLGYVMASEEWLPAFNESSYTISITTKPWSSLEYTLDITKNFSLELRKISWIERAGAILWRADADAHAQWSNNAEIEVALAPDVTNEEKARIYDEINGVIGKYKQVAVIGIGQPITHRVEEIISGIRAPLVIKIFGEDLDTLETLGKQIVEIANTVEGTLNISLESQTKIPSITVTPNTPSLVSQKVNYNEVKELLDVGIGGQEVARVIEWQNSYPVVMRFPISWTSTPESIRSIPFWLSDERTFFIGNVANVELGKSRNIINHENSARRIVISWYTKDRSIVDVVDDIKKEVEKLDIPSGYRVSYEGLYSAQKESSKLLMFISIGVLLALFGILYWHFGSIVLVLQIFLGIVTGWFWGILWVWLTGGVISTAHLVGFIALMGIVSRNGIMLIDHYKHLCLEEWLPFDKNTILKGSLERIVPVSMTALSAILGLLPLVLWAGDAGKEMLSPIATVIFWWLFVSTLIELALRPWIFYRYYREGFHPKASKNTYIVE